NSLQAYSLEKSGKQISCCNSYLCSKGIGIYLTFLAEKSFRNNKKDFYLTAHTDQLLIKKDFFLKNIKKFYNLFKGLKINIFTEENTAFISLPLVKIYGSKLNPYLINRDIFTFNFLDNFRPLVYQRNLFTNPYVYNLIIESLFKRKFFMMRELLKDFLSPDKFGSFKRIYKKNL
ncbi:MAG TPA: hypothetical protein VMZ91_13455, partial [Candidatus Paceibacterota bacterium]|nr:hypothetical protein [Candidatus Paceibacterota bacterium]